MPFHGEVTGRSVCCPSFNCVNVAVPIARTSIADEMREEHRRRVLGE